MQAETIWQALDLTYLADSMASENYPLPRWQHAAALQCVARYKNFLWLHHLHPDVPLVPTKEIDECWHNHILYTQRYTRDCQQLFGHYFHHQPATPGDNDAKLATDYLKTKELYLQTFHHEINS